MKLTRTHIRNYYGEGDKARHDHFYRWCLPFPINILHIRHGAMDAIASWWRRHCD